MADYKEAVVNKIKSTLPLMSHYSDAQLVTTVDNSGEVPKNIVPWYLITKLVILGGLGVAFVMYALPMIMTIIGVTFGVIVSAALVFAAIVLGPVYKKYLVELAKTIRKRMIDSDPFTILFGEKDRMIKNKKVFLDEKSNMAVLTNKTANLSAENETKALTIQSNITNILKRVERTKAKISDGLKEGGEAYKETAEYNSLSNELRKLLAESNRSSSQLIQYKNFTEVYGIRANLFKKVGYQMDTILTAMDIKIDDFDVSIEMLKNEYDLAKNLKATTESAKRAMGLNKSWEVDYALEIVTLTIERDNASSISNMVELSQITKELNLDFDNEESYDRLKLLANNISGGIDLVPSPNKYSNPDYVFTNEDKTKSGGFGSLM